MRSDIPVNPTVQTLLAECVRPTLAAHGVLQDICAYRTLEVVRKLRGKVQACCCDEVRDDLFVDCHGCGSLADGPEVPMNREGCTSRVYDGVSLCENFSL